MLKVAEYAKRTNEIKQKASEALSKADIALAISCDSTKPIKLVFAGQYSAGKSSIIKMLTGNEDIEVGAGITTMEAHKYEWNGMEIVDTPGVHTQLRPDHDEISYKEIMSADMLVFVITNELFDDHLARHFRTLAIEKDKAGEMLLVVNKMERTTNGNTEEQQNIIKADLEKVLTPYTPEQLGITFIDAQTYLDALKERNNDPEFADELLKRSGYEEFVEALNIFVKEKSLASRLTTELYEIDAQLESAIKEVQPASEDRDIDALEENYLQQRHELLDSRNRLQREIADIYAASAVKLRDLGIEAASWINEASEQEEVENKLAISVENANEIIETCQTEASQVFEKRMNEIGQAIEIIEQSEFTQQLVDRLENRFDTLPEGVKKMLGNAGIMAKEAGKVVLEHAYKDGVKGGLKLANFAGGDIHNIVLKAGHAIGFKFKPWQAVKIAKGVAVGGQILGAFGVALSVFMQIKEDHDQEKRALAIRENRQNIRCQFNAAAGELEDHGRQYISENILVPLDQYIYDIDSNIAEIRSNRIGKNDLCIELEQIQRSCRELIQEIHSA